MSWRKQTLKETSYINELLKFHNGNKNKDDEADDAYGGVDEYDNCEEDEFMRL